MHTLLDLLREPPVARPDPADDTGAGDRFWARGELPAGQLAIDVEGVGALAQPLSSAQAEALHGLSAPAHVGRREQTLLDTAVRHTGEVSADRLTLDWAPGAFAALQREVAQALGVERLDAWLHNLLIYGPGQFFKPHQDTERHPGMVATLVLVWPSPHIGGELRVRLGEAEGRLASQHLQARDTLRWFAFYADCRHEVLPVEEGWRVVLTFDLVTPQTALASALPGARQQALQEALRQTFQLDEDTPRLAPWVLLLDHEYTEHGLRWALLKGDDRWRVAALRQAVEALGLRVHLALAELHETWSTQPVFRSRRSHYGREYDTPTDEVEPEELIDGQLSLDFWVDTHDRVGPRRSLGIRSEDAVSFVETGETHLVDEQYEGYMGNYGDTIDYWYRRAALVIRAPLADERDRFELDFDAALADAGQLARDPAQAAALAARIRAAAQALERQAAERGRDLLPAYAEIAAALPEPEDATALLAAFDLTRLEPADAEVLAALGRRRGADGLVTLIRTWTTPDETAYRRGMFAAWRPNWPAPQQMPRLWPRSLPDFVERAQQAAWPAEALEGLTEAALRLLVRLGNAVRQASPVLRQHLQADLRAAAADLAAALVRRGEAGARQRGGLTDHLIDQPALYPPQTLRPVVEALGSTPDAERLRQHVVAALRTALAEPERTADDHGLRGIDWTCRCADCAGMIAWAESPLAQPLVMAMAEPRRQHVTRQLGEAGAPLGTTTLRQGSPHKLVLSKPADLRSAERVQREGWAQDLARLTAA